MHTTLALALLFTLQQPLPSDSAVRAVLTARVQTFPDTAKHGEGIVVGLLDASGRRRYVAVGVDTGGVFEIGSITKTFTATILADMVARGEVRLDDPVSKFLPSSAHIPARGGKQITLLDLATQSSGLPRMPSNMTARDPSNPYADYTVDQMYAFLAGYELPRDIGATYEYSNLGVGLLGHALALKAGMSYEQLVTRRILAPLGMRESAITFTPAMKAKLAPGHDADGKVVPNWDLPTLAGAGALRSTTRDMLTYLAANLDTTTALGRAMRDAHTPRREAGNPSMRIGLAWHILSRPAGSIVWHNGGTGGYRTFTGFDPVRRVGVVVLSNLNAGVDDIGFHLLDETFPLQQPPPPGAHIEVAVDSLVLARYVGEYELAPTFHITVTREGTNLFLQATAQPRFRVYAESDSTFFLKVVDAQVTFRPDAMVLHQNGQNLPGRKVR